MSFILSDILFHLSQETLLQRGIVKLYQDFEEVISKDDIIQFKELNLKRRKIGAYCLNNNDLDAYVDYLKEQINLVQNLKKQGHIEKIAILLNLDERETSVVLKMLEMDEGQQLFLWLLIYNNEQLQDAEELDIPKTKVRDFRQELIKRLSTQKIFDIKHTAELLPEAFACLESGVLENQNTESELSIKMLNQFFEYHILENNFQFVADSIMFLIERLPKLFEKLYFSWNDGVQFFQFTPFTPSKAELGGVGFDQIKDKIAYLIVCACAGHVTKEYDLPPEVYRSFKQEIVSRIKNKLKLETCVSAEELLGKIKEINLKEPSGLSKGVVLLLDFWMFLVDDFIENRPKAFAEKLALWSDFYINLSEKFSPITFDLFLGLSHSKDDLALQVLTKPLHHTIYWLEQFTFEGDLALYTNTPLAKIQDFRKQVQAALGDRYEQEDVFSLIKEKPKGTREQVEQFFLLNDFYLRAAYRERDHKKFVEGIQCLFAQALQAYKINDFASLNTLLFSKSLLLLDQKSFGEMIVLFEQDKAPEIYKFILNRYLCNLSKREMRNRYSDRDRFYSYKAIEKARIQQDHEIVSFVQEIYKNLVLSDPPHIAPREYPFKEIGSVVSIGESPTTGKIPKSIVEWAKTFQENLQSGDLNKINEVARTANNLFIDAYRTQDTSEAIALFEAIFSPLNKLSDGLKKQYCKFINQFLREVNMGYIFSGEDVSRLFQLLQNGSYNLFKTQVLMNIHWGNIKIYKKEISHHGFMEKLFSKLSTNFDSEIKGAHELFDKFLESPTSSELQFDKALPELVAYLRYLYVQAMLGGRMDRNSLVAREKLASMVVKYSKMSQQKIKELLGSSFLGALKILLEGSNLTTTLQYPRMLWKALQYDYEPNNFLERASLPTGPRTWLYEMVFDSADLKEEADFPTLKTNSLLPTCQFMLEEIDKANTAKDKYVAIHKTTLGLLEIFAHHISIEDYRTLAQDIYQTCTYLFEKHKAGDFLIFNSVISSIVDHHDNDDMNEDLWIFRSQKALSTLLGVVFSRNATKSWNNSARHYYVPQASRILIRNNALAHIEKQFKIQVVPDLNNLTEIVTVLLKDPIDFKTMTFYVFQKELLLFDAFARGDHKTLSEAIKILTEFSFKAYQKDRALLIEFFQLTSELSFSKSESHQSEDHNVNDQNKRLIRWCYHFNSNNPKQIMILILKEVFKEAYHFLDFDQYQSLEQTVYEALGITILDRFDPRMSSGSSPEELKKMADFVYSQSNAGVDLLKDLESISFLAKKAEFNKLLPKPKTEDSVQYHKVYNKVQDIWHMHLVVHRFSLQSNAPLEGSMDNTMPQQVHDNFLRYLEQKEVDEFIKAGFQRSKIEIKQEDELIEQFKNTLREDMQALFLSRKTSSADIKLRFEQGKQLSFPIHTTFCDTTGDVDGHLSAAVFFKLSEQWFMFKSDRGGDTPAKESGINLYKVSKPEDIQAVAEKMAAGNETSIPNETYKALVKDNLGLQKIGHIYKKPQFIGGCGFISAAKPLAEINCLVHMMKLIYQNNSKLEAAKLLNQAKYSIKPLTSDFSVYDRYQVLNDFINHLKIQLDIQQYNKEDLEHIKILLAQIQIMNENRPARQKILELLDDKNLPEALRFGQEHLEAANKALQNSFGDLLLGATELEEDALALKVPVFDKTTKDMLIYYRTKQHVDSAEFGRQLQEEGAKLAKTLPSEVLERAAVKKAKKSQLTT